MEFNGKWFVLFFDQLRLDMRTNPYFRFVKRTLMTTTDKAAHFIPYGGLSLGNPDILRCGPRPEKNLNHALFDLYTVNKYYLQQTFTVFLSYFIDHTNVRYNCMLC